MNPHAAGPDFAALAEACGTSGPEASRRCNVRQVLATVSQPMVPTKWNSMAWSQTPVPT